MYAKLQMFIRAVVMDNILLHASSNDLESTSPFRYARNVLESLPLWWVILVIMKASWRPFSIVKRHFGHHESFMETVFDCQTTFWSS
ncbi:hypothetical protein [Mesobacillus maritimus]|uniref:hypothetical protein n=1 Tax=Mesobacillus maritimus TaxID=1643336 RepID=UPI00384B7CD9